MKDIAADNAAADKAAYGREAMVSVPLLELVYLLGAGDHMHAFAEDDYAKDAWLSKAEIIRNFINEQS